MRVEVAILTPHYTHLCHSSEFIYRSVCVCVCAGVEQASFPFFYKVKCREYWWGQFGRCFIPYLVLCHICGGWFLACLFLNRYYWCWKRWRGWVESPPQLFQHQKNKPSSGIGSIFRIRGGGCLGKGNESGSCHVCIWRRMFVCVGGFRCAGCGVKKVYWVLLQLLLFSPTSHFSLNPSHIFTDHLYGSPSLPPHPSDQR